MSKYNFGDIESNTRRNSFMILTPITQEEKDYAESTPYGAEHIVALYQLPDNDEIQIGLLSPTQKRFFPSKANVENLKYATNIAYFHNGYTELIDIRGKKVNRPIYMVYPNGKNTVRTYKILNANYDNGLAIPLKDIVNGTVTIETERLIEKTK